MKTKILITLTFIFVYILGINAQEKTVIISSSKKTISFNNAPELQIKTIRLLDENGNRVADAEESCKFILEITNKGKSTAKAVNILTQIVNGVNESLSFAPSTYIGNIAINEIKNIEISITSGVSLKDGTVGFKFTAQEANNYDSKPINFDLKIKAKDVPLAINWQYPIMARTMVNEDKYTIKACIVSSKPIVNAEVYVNNKKIKDVRAFKLIKSKTCNHFLEKEITLQEGDNKIKIIVQNSETTLVSKEMTLSLIKESYEHRLALVIGNSKYKSSPLRNPKNDAHSMAKALANLNFEVIEVLDGDKKTMKQSLRDFSDKLNEYHGVALFYYAGHGIQVKGDNYLVPVNHDIKEEYDVPDEAINVNTVLAYMESSGTRMNIVVLDACRDNPFFTRSVRSGSNRGLAQIYAEGSGSIIAFATAPGSVAQDGKGNNGLYTQELLKAIKTPGLEIGMVFRRVLTSVKKLSTNKQIPWTNSSIEGEFYFLK